MEIFFTHSSLKEFKKIPKKDRERIIKKLKFFVSKDPLAYAKPMKDRRYGDWRFRIGDYRVIFDIIEDSLYILKIGHRKDIYK